MIGKVNNHIQKSMLKISQLE